MGKNRTTSLKKSREKYAMLGAMQSGAGSMTYRDIKRQAIILGMPFPDATGNSIGALLNYISRTTNTPDPSLIDKYDEWMDFQLSERGYAKDDPLRSSRLRLGFLGEEQEDGSRRTKRIKGVKKPKEKKPRQKDERGLVVGTKKSYTFELAAKGFTLERVIRRVKKKFPDANEKSISLWFRKATRKKK